MDSLPAELLGKSMYMCMYTHIYRYTYVYIHTYIESWASQVALVVMNLFANAGDLRDTGSVSGLGRSPGEGHGNPLQYACLENPHGQRSLAGYSPLGHKSQTRLNDPAQGYYRIH